MRSTTFGMAFYCRPKPILPPHLFSAAIILHFINIQKIAENSAIRLSYFTLLNTVRKRTQLLHADPFTSRNNDMVQNLNTQNMQAFHNFPAALYI